jgi:hypothetical protein
MIGHAVRQAFIRLAFSAVDSFLNPVKRLQWTIITKKLMKKRS